ncbi:Chs5p-Arf1p-binding proteins-domain-containing protein [Umbelopsis sp. PMI_123]|nr:Chs5p-Arf1p-binding proteins-domain-containing protein [Umbelopsis sp. PMI_123]
MSENLKDIPEFFENTLGESIATRTDQLGAFRELGPPDLCHITKTNLKPGQKEIGSYHYVSGVDASSSASIAAYLNSLTYSIDEHGAWFGKGEWKIRGATYCCYNAFSRMDIRVEVKIPGGVESYCVDTHGERHEATNQMWLETYLSACVRAILFADDGNYRIAGYRKLDPIPNVGSEARFLDAAHNLFDKGWLLGSNPEVQTATIVKNHLSDALMKFFSYNFQLEPLIDFLERLYGKDPEIGALLAKAYIESDQEIKAVHLIYKTLQIAPTKYTVLHAQVDFLVSKGAIEEALKIAKFAVNCMPSEFLTWSKLASVYIELGEYKMALLALNSCPMFTYSERDQHRMLPPARTHLPIKLALLESGLLEHEILMTNTVMQSDPNLLRLPAAALHGTFLQAYSLLTKLASKVGWDELLRARSDVFVMEEEYRKAKEAEETRRKSTTIETIKQSKENGLKDADTDDNDSNIPSGARTPTSGNAGDEKELPSPVGKNAKKNQKKRQKKKNKNKKLDLSPNVANDGEEPDEVPSPVTPVVGGLDSPALVQPTEEDTSPGDKLDINSEEFAEIDITSSESVTVDVSESVEKEDTTLETPEAVVQEEPSAAESNVTAADEPDQKVPETHKRLCERWLDNLFIVLYEDLRQYTVWRTEIQHYKAQQLEYHKNSTEWEILGDLATRLCHEPEAKEAYQNCLEQRFSPRAWTRLLEIYADDGDLQNALSAAVKLAVYHNRWYNEMTNPTHISLNLNKIIKRHGLSKVRNSLTAMNLIEPIHKLISQYFDNAAMFQVDGYDF